MDTTAAPQSNPFLAVLTGGLICGVLDITAALVVYGYFGLRPIRLLQGIAAGILGPGSYNGGFSTAALGLLSHFFIAFSACTVFYLASRWLPVLLQHAILSGALYGIAVYFFMNPPSTRLSHAKSKPCVILCASLNPSFLAPNSARPPRPLFCYHPASHPRRRNEL